MDLKRRRAWRLAAVLTGALVLAGVCGAVVVESLGPWAVISAPNMRRSLQTIDALPGNSALDEPVRRGVARALRFEVGPPAAALAVWILDPPAAAAPGARSPRGTLFVLHGIRDRKEGMLGWGQRLAAAGYRTVLVDARGHGRSSGDFLSYGAVEAGDLRQVLDRLAQQGLVQEPVGAMGISYGAALAIQWAGRDERIKSVVAVAPFRSLRDVVPPYFRKHVPGLGALVPGFLFDRVIANAGHKGGFDPALASPLTAITHTRAPVLLVHGSRDSHIPPAHSQELHAQAKAHSELQLVADADHDTITAERYGVLTRALSWFAQTLPPTERAEVAPECAPLPDLPASPPADLAVRVRLLECAARSAQGMTDASWARVGIERVAVGYAELGDAHRALRTVCAPPFDEPARARTLHEVARQLVRRGQIDQATTLAIRIEQAKTRYSEPKPSPSELQQSVLPQDPFETASVWNEIGVQQCRSGDLKTALESLNRRWSSAKCGSLLRCYEALVERKDAAGATRALEEAADCADSLLPQMDGDLVADVAVTIARAGQRGRAEALLRNSLKHIRGAPDEREAGAGDVLIEGLVRIGLHGEASRLRQRGLRLASGAVLPDLLAAGQVATARRLATSIPRKEGYHRALALGLIAEKLEQLGRKAEALAIWKDAESTAMTAALPRFRVDVLSALAVRRAAGQPETDRDALFEDALRIARLISDPDERLSSLREVASSLAEAGRCTRGLAVAEEVQDDGYAIHEVAVKCTNDAELESVLQRTDRIKYPDHRGQALAALAVRQARKGLLAGAMTTLGRSTDGPSTVRALVEMATGDLPDAPLPACP